MQTATLVVSSIGCVFAIGAFGVSLKTALELRKAKKNIDHEVNKVKAKVVHNARVVKTAMQELQT
jgi:hypothetical protein